MRIRLWLVAVVCFTCGLVSRIVFVYFAPSPDSRAVAYHEAQFQLFWFGLGLLLFLAHLIRLTTQMDKAKGCRALGFGCVFWLVGVFVALFVAFSTIGD